MVRCARTNNFSGHPQRYTLYTLQRRIFNQIEPNQYIFCCIAALQSRTHWDRAHERSAGIGAQIRLNRECDRCRESVDLISARGKKKQKKNKDIEEVYWSMKWWLWLWMSAKKRKCMPSLAHLPPFCTCSNFGWLSTSHFTSSWICWMADFLCVDALGIADTTQTYTAHTHKPQWYFLQFYHTQFGVKLVFPMLPLA